MSHSISDFSGNKPTSLNPDDAEALLAITAHLRSPSPEWVSFIGETLSHWLVEQRVPHGEVDEAKANWLIERIDDGGEVNSPAALNLLQRCCVKAQRVPQRLMQYLQVQEARMA